MSVTYPNPWPGSPTQPDLHQLEKDIAADATLAPVFGNYEGAYWDDATPAVLTTQWAAALTVGPMGQQAALTAVIAALATGYSDETLFVAGENLNAGEFVNIYDNAGVRSVRKANADTVTPGERPADGFVLDSVLIGSQVRVHFEGQNPLVDGTALVLADVGSDMFLSTTAGAAVTAPDTSADNIIQVLGKLIDLVIAGGRATIEFAPARPALVES